MIGLVAEGMDVAEIYSQPRVAARAQVFGLRPGWSLDTTIKDVHGRRWDFSKREMALYRIQGHSLITGVIR